MGVVKDLFFVARIRETARMVGTPLSFARTPLELETALADAPDLVILALARATQPLHARCARVVTKETLTQELPELLKSGVTA